MYRLMIVDDDELIRLGLQSVIDWTGLGFALCGAFPNALEALEAFKNLPCDVLLTDIKMPEMTGLELIAKAQKHNPALKSIVISGYDEFDLAQKALRLKVEEYLLKPLGQKEIELAFTRLKNALDAQAHSVDIGSSTRMIEKERELLQIFDQQVFDEIETIKPLLGQLISDIENGSYVPLQETVLAIHGAVRIYPFRDVFYCYSSLISRLVQYFKIDSDTNFIYGSYQFREVDRAHRSLTDFERDFDRDIENLLRILRENSDSMRNIMVDNAKKLMNEQYADSALTLACIANKLDISYGYLSTIFTKVTGKSFKTYLVEMRMEKARVLLLSRKHRDYEIAQMVGYSNPRYFNDAFKKHFGCSPADYIARLRGNIT